MRHKPQGHQTVPCARFFFFLISFFYFFPAFTCFFISSFSLPPFFSYSFYLLYFYFIFTSLLLREFFNPFHIFFFLRKAARISFGNNNINLDFNPKPNTTSQLTSRSDFTSELINASLYCLYIFLHFAFP